MQISKSFEADKNRKALIYTLSICALLLLMFILISWKVQPPTAAVVQDLMEINLGNNNEGFGEEQPLIKGNRSPAEENVAPPQIPQPAPEVPDRVIPDDNAEADAASVNKPEKKVVVKTNTKDIAPVEHQLRSRLPNQRSFTTDLVQETEIMPQKITVTNTKEIIKAVLEMRVIQMETKTVTEIHQAEKLADQRLFGVIDLWCGIIHLPQHCLKQLFTHK